MSSYYYIGTLGWHYDHWRGGFYPDKLNKTAWLEFYARHFNTIEFNSNFYRLPSEDAFVNWRDSSPVNFIFAVKVSRFITHIKRLKNAGDAVEKFISRAKILGGKLGSLSYRLPPNMHRNDDRLAPFLSSLPGKMKHVFEFRHQSCLEAAVFEILHKYSAGLCVFDMSAMTCPLVATVDFAYLRFHDSTGLYSSYYSDGELADWVKRLAALGTDLKTVYVYFNNDIEAFAVRNAAILRCYLEKVG